MKRFLSFCLCLLPFSFIVHAQGDDLDHALHHSNLLEQILSDANMPGAVLYEVRPGDTLSKIARKHRTTQELIKKRNHLTGNRIKVGQRLSLWGKPFNIEVDKATNQLFLKVDDEIIKVYPVSTGKADSVTPVGEFVIRSRYPDPTWFHKGQIVPGGASDNWLGTRWLGFDIPKYGIHGTIHPDLIGQSVSGGCVRMRNEDVEELYDLVPVGTKVVIKEWDPGFDPQGAM